MKDRPNRSPWFDTDFVATDDNPFAPHLPPQDYHAHFGFEQAPFDIESDPSLFVLSPRHEEALDKMHRALLARKSISVLTGRAGTGKTLLIQTLLGLAESPWDCAYVFNPAADIQELLTLILNEFGVSAYEMTKAEKLRALYDFVLECRRNGRQPLIAIDDAQRLSVQTLDELRSIANLANPSGLRLQFLLAGNNDFNRLLASPALSDFRERIGARFETRPLTLNQSYRYINQRCLLAGASRVVFPKDVIIRIFSLSRGRPRLINIVCDALLLQTFLNKRRLASVSDVKRVATDLKLPFAPILPRPKPAQGGNRPGGQPQ